MFLWACGTANGPFAEPAAVPDRAPLRQGCEGLEIVERVRIGGEVSAVIAEEEWVAASLDPGLGIFHGRQWIEAIETAGSPIDLAMYDGALWVAEGRAGLTRIRSPWSADRTVDTRTDGGHLVAVAGSGDWMYIADSRGRVLAVPADGKPDVALTLTVGGALAAMPPPFAVSEATRVAVHRGSRAVAD